jgi:hypothetical protein
MRCLSQGQPQSGALDERPPASDLINSQIHDGNPLRLAEKSVSPNSKFPVFARSIRVSAALFE